MLADKQEVLAVDQMRILFGAAPILKGEDEEHYWSLCAAFAADLNPKTWPDWITVYDLAHKYWEQLRLRRYSPALIEGACIEALASLLRPFFENTMANEDVPAGIARNYYAGNAQAKKEAVRSVTEYGITTNQIFALAMQMRGVGLLMLDRMDSNRQNVCRVLRKEIERRGAASENPPDCNPRDDK
jgi:hypothetical protein